MILVDQIREHVRKEITTPDRQKDLTTVHVRAGNFHSAMELQNRMPAVCAALYAEKFLDYAQVILVRRSGPHQGSSAEWVFQI